MKKTVKLSALLAMLLCISACNNHNISNDSEKQSQMASETKQSESIESVVVKKDLSLSQQSLIGMIGTEYNIYIEDYDNSKITLDYQAKDFYTITLKSNGLISINLISEGKDVIKIKTENSNEVYFSIEAINLKLVYETNHIDVGPAGIELSINKDVDATISVESDSAKYENGKLIALKEDIFDVCVSYGDITIIETFDSFVHRNKIDSLPRHTNFVRYHGRNYHSDGRVIMNNIGSGFEVQFYGTELKANLSGWFGSWYGRTKISVLIDGNIDTSKKIVTLTSGTTKKEYTLASKLKEGIHTIKVLKRTEGISTELSLYDISTDGYFMPAPKDDRLKIEAYGDSITAGYGNLRGDLADTTSSDYQNGLQTYATYTASLLDADINVQARTGIGMYTAANIDDNEQVNNYYKYTSFAGDYLWNFDNYTPDLVLINLGTNDSWNGGVFNEDRFIDEYIQFVTTLADIYGEDTSFILCSGFMENTVEGYLETVVSLLESTINNEVYQFTFDKCKGGHPLDSEHLAGANQLVEFIRENDLDVIHTSTVDKVEEKTSSEEVDFEINAEVKDILPDYVDIYANIEGKDPIKLGKSSTNPFIYQTTVKLTENDYNVSFNLNNDQNYNETNPINDTIYVRKEKKSQTIELNSFMNVPKDPNPNADTFGWEISRHLFEASINPTDANNIIVENNNWMAAFVTRRATIGDNYIIEATLKGTMTATVDQAFMGLLPYYIDDQNFIVVYFQWNSDGSFKSIGCTGQSNGTDIGWHDYWTFANSNVDIANGTKLTIERHQTSLKISMLGKTETQTLASMKLDNENYGVWNYGVISTYQDITEKAS